MPEEMNIEAAYALSERDKHAPQGERRRREVGEVFEVVILATVAVATAWSGYQAARWDGRQAFLYGESTRVRIEADEAATLGGQQRLLTSPRSTRGSRPARRVRTVSPISTSSDSLPISASPSMRGC